jgi:hypothetical protein
MRGIFSLEQIAIFGYDKFGFEGFLSEVKNTAGGY